LRSVRTPLESLQYAPWLNYKGCLPILSRRGTDRLGSKSQRRDSTAERYNRHDNDDDKVNNIKT